MAYYCPTCDAPAVVEDSHMHNGAPMPVEIVKIRCMINPLHWFMGDL